MHRKRAVRTVIALAALALTACSGGGTKGDPGVSSATPDPVDVAAARACEAFTKWLGAGAGDMQPIIDATQPLLAGQSPAKWAQLADHIRRGARAANAQDHAAMFSTSLQVGRECGSIPVAAMKAGGFVNQKHS